MVNIEIKETHVCRSDIRIATKLTDSRESEFPPTTQNVLLILKFTIVFIWVPMSEVASSLRPTRVLSYFASEVG